jgi:hypothetical protein
MITIRLVMAVLALGVLAQCGSARGQEGFEQLIPSHNRRFTKHGWNHYGPGYFELDPTTGVLTSHGGMGLFWYAAKQYGNDQLRGVPQGAGRSGE